MPPLARPASTSESFLSPSSSSRRPPELPPLQAAARPRPAATRPRSVAVPPHSATARRARSRAPRFSLFLPHKRPPRSFPIPLTAYSNAVMHPHLTPLSPRPCACDSDASIGRAWIPPLRRWKSAALPQALAASPHPQAPVVANLRSPATRRARPRSRPRCRDRCAPFVVAGGTCSGESGLMAGLERRGASAKERTTLTLGTSPFSCVLTYPSAASIPTIRHRHARSSRPSPRSPRLDQSEPFSARRRASPGRRRAESVSCACAPHAAHIASELSHARCSTPADASSTSRRPGMPPPPPLYPLRRAYAAREEQWRWSALTFETRRARWRIRGAAAICLRGDGDGMRAVPSTVDTTQQAPLALLPRRRAARPTACRRT
ncbi:hypothetical protein B0H10DRAFT_734667 [Mycena sp. CBHHK59/15]|nr:hypothetical protein B0H10DRAFT_734667 [Mycena sp. CBHHK59/15]